MPPESRTPLSSGELALVVDDDEDFRASLGALLRLLGFRVALAANGQEALDLLASQNPAIMFTDLSMPVLDGFELLRRVRAFASHPQIIVITGADRDPEAVRRTVTDLGASALLVKPCGVDELTAAIIAARRLRDKTERG